jgi:hypothetical protein
MPVRHAGAAIGTVLSVSCASLLFFFWTAQPSEEDASTADIPLSASNPVSGPKTPAAPAIVTPAKGDSTVLVNAGGVTLLANAAPRRAILYKLSQDAHFAIEDHTRNDPLLTITLVQRPLTQAIAETLSGTAYALHYSGRKGPHTEAIGLLEVGVAPSPVQPDEFKVADLDNHDLFRDDHGGLDRKRLDKGERPRKKVVSRTSPELTPAQRAQWQHQRAVRAREYREQLMGELHSELADERRFAVFGLDPTAAEDIPLINEALFDSDSMVRLEAVQHLRWAAEGIALPALTVALQDNSVEVVLAAIDALGNFDDPEAAAGLREVTNHVDERVRNAADEQIEAMR